MSASMVEVGFTSPAQPDLLLKHLLEKGKTYHPISTLIQIRNPKIKEWKILQLEKVA